ncbi:MAG: hypothetical protein GC151_03325 [Betaproteobacteria bacterium]|nr:hypothetical protein [Betaproteobacteria bacterium]
MNDRLQDDLRAASKANVLISELLGIPSYLAMFLISIRYSGDGWLRYSLVFICFVLIYHHVYSHVFRGFDNRLSARGAALFFFGQVVVWGVILGVLFRF